MQKKWSDTFVSQKDFAIVAGENHSGRVEFNLNEYPHALIKGEIGSGKSVFLQCLLWQCIKKGAQVYILDFNGALKISALEKLGKVSSCFQDMQNLLQALNQEAQCRWELFKTTGTKNFTEYNQMVQKEPLARIVVACDGVSETLDMTGNDIDKTVLRKIKSEMFTLVNISHDVGIHIFITTCEVFADTFDMPIIITMHRMGECDYFARSDSGQFWAYIFKDTDLEIDPDKWENSNMQQAPEGKEDTQMRLVKPVNLYPEMNEKIASLLEISDAPIDLYAAAYIRHLQAQLKGYEMKVRNGNDATEQD